MARTCWQYILKALQWARKYGLRVKVDLHTIPGSQNGVSPFITNPVPEAGSDLSGPESTNPLTLTHRSLTSPSPLAFHRLEPFWKGAKWCSKSTQWRHGCRQRPEGSQLHPHLWRILCPTRVLQPDRYLRHYERAAPECNREEFFDLIVCFSLLYPNSLIIAANNPLYSYVQAHNMLREITGVGKGFYIAIGDGFAGIDSWAGYLPNSDRLILDSHPYFAFDGEANNQPIADTGPDGRPGGIWPQQACGRWALQLLDRYVCIYSLKQLSRREFRVSHGSSLMATSLSQSAFGINIAGEYSNGFNDCAFWLRGPGNDETSNPDCPFWTNYAAWNDTVKEGLKNFALASMDALVYPFFWTWKVSRILIRHLGGALWPIVSIPSFRLTTGVSTSTFAPKQLARAPVLPIFFYATRLAPKLTPIFISLPSHVIWSRRPSSPLHWPLVVK